MKAVIFDLDGVIIDSEPVHYRAFAKTLYGEGVKDVSFEYYKQFVGSTNQHMWETAIYDFGLKKSIVQLREKDEENRNALIQDEGYIPITGARELVWDLYNHDVKLAVASSSSQTYIQDAVGFLNIQDCFLKLVSGESLEYPKPAPDIFLKAAELLHMSQKQCIVIEDSCNGVKAAKAAGMICLALKNSNSGNQDLCQADFILDSFEGINFEKLDALVAQAEVKK